MHLSININSLIKKMTKVLDKKEKYEDCSIYTRQLGTRIKKDAYSHLPLPATDLSDERSRHACAIDKCTTPCTISPPVKSRFSRSPFPFYFQKHHNYIKWRHDRMTFSCHPNG